MSCHLLICSRNCGRDIYKNNNFLEIELDVVVRIVLGPATSPRRLYISYTIPHIIQTCSSKHSALLLISMYAASPFCRDLQRDKHLTPDRSLLPLDCMPTDLQITAAEVPPPLPLPPDPESKTTSLFERDGPARRDFTKPTDSTSRGGL